MCQFERFKKNKKRLKMINVNKNVEEKMQHFQMIEHAFQEENIEIVNSSIYNKDNKIIFDFMCESYGKHYRFTHIYFGSYAMWAFDFWCVYNIDIAQPLISSVEFFKEIGLWRVLRNLQKNKNKPISK